MDPLDSPSQVTCSMCKPHELIPSSYCDPYIQVLPWPSFQQGGKMAENGGLWLNQMEETQRVRHGSI